MFCVKNLKNCPSEIFLEVSYIGNFFLIAIFYADFNSLNFPLWQDHPENVKIKNGQNMTFIFENRLVCTASKTENDRFKKNRLIAGFSRLSLYLPSPS
jgi:hypothetical protein